MKERRELGKQLNVLRSEEANYNTHAQFIDKELRDSNFALKLIRQEAPPEQFSLEEDREAHREKVAKAEKDCSEGAVAASRAQFSGAGLEAESDEGERAASPVKPRD